MTDKTMNLPGDEELYLKLHELYESYGYQKYKMQKFEEYSLYLDHKDFLTSSAVLTFTEPGGRLLALRPDVTLSIVKNTKATESSTEKLYYRENVYRLDKSSKTYKEISQIGVEAIGDIDLVESAEIVSLAAKSLSTVDTDFVLSLSHTGFLAGLLDYAGIDLDSDRRLAADYLRSQSTHELAALLGSYNVPTEYTDKLSALLLMNSSFSQTIENAKAICMNAPMERAIAELEAVYRYLEGTSFAASLKLDFTVQSDLHYYFGLIMKGYVKGCPRAVLTGGRYDKLLRKFDRRIGAMGFALFLGEIVSYYPANENTDFDVLLIYSDSDDPIAVENTANKLREAGKRVRIARSKPIGLRFTETFIMGGKV